MQGIKKLVNSLWLLSLKPGEFLLNLLKLDKAYNKMCLSKLKVFMRYEVQNYILHLMTTEHSLVLWLLCVASLITQKCKPWRCLQIKDVYR